jgi:hypothetical protein
MRVGRGVARARRPVRSLPQRRVVVSADAPGPRGSKAGGPMPFPSFHGRGHGWIAGRELLPGSYLTDGCTLFRVTSRLAVTRNELLISLEDCRTLEIQSYASSELGLIGLQPVRASERVEAVHDACRFGHDVRLGAVAHQRQSRVSSAGMNL